MRKCPNQCEKHWGYYQIRTLIKARLKSNTYSEGQFLASEDPDARDAAVVVGAEQDDTGKGILSEFVQALEHTCEVQSEICQGHLLFDPYLKELLSLYM